MPPPIYAFDPIVAARERGYFNGLVIRHVYERAVVNSGRELAGGQARFSELLADLRHGGGEQPNTLAVQPNEIVIAPALNSIIV